MSGAPRPGLFSLPPGAPFARAFAQGFFARHGDLPPGQIARITVMVNTALAARLIE